MSRLEIPVAAEGFQLVGQLDGAAPGPGLLVCHPHPAFAGTMDTPLVAALAEAAAASGLRALRFNFRGIGGSGGEPEGGRAEFRDVTAAAAWLRASTGGPIAIAGYSFGALMAAAAISTGEAFTRYAAIALPTVIVRGHEDRVTAVRAAFAAQPTLLIAGTNDQFCDLADLREWSRHAPLATLDERPGVDHFPTGEALRSLIARVVDFVRA